jgi:hypothetical protein
MDVTLTLEGTREGCFPEEVQAWVLEENDTIVIEHVTNGVPCGMATCAICSVERTVSIISESHANLSSAVGYVAISYGERSWFYPVAVEQAPTFNGFGGYGGAKIDYILAKDYANVTSTIIYDTVDGYFPSDHALMIADV